MLMILNIDSKKKYVKF